MPPRGEMMDDWVSYPYEEKGRSFVVCQLRDQHFPAPLSDQKWPLSTLSRDGRYLFPLTRVHDTNIVFMTTPKMYHLQRRHFRFRPSDVSVCGFPRTGSTWLEQVMLLIFSRGDPSCLNTSEKNTYKPTRPDKIGKVLIESMFADGTRDIAEPWGSVCGQDVRMPLHQIDQLAFRRLFKTHYPPHLLVGFGEHSQSIHERKAPPFHIPDVKFIVGIRDPKDACVSLHRVNALNLEKMGIPFVPYVKLFLEGKYFCDSWADYYAEWVEVKKAYPDRVLFVPYEDNHTNPGKWIGHMASFVGVDLTDEEVESCVRWSSFAAMKEMSKKSRAEHVHVGKVGGWRDSMTQEMLVAFNRLVADPRLGDLGRRYMCTS